MLGLQCDGDLSLWPHHVADNVNRFGNHIHQSLRGFVASLQQSRLAQFGSVSYAALAVIGSFRPPCSLPSNDKGHPTVILTTDSDDGVCKIGVMG